MNKVYIKTSRANNKPLVTVAFEAYDDTWDTHVLNKQETLTLAAKLIKAANQMDHIQLTDNVIDSREIEIT